MTLEVMQALAIGIPVGCLAFWATEWWFGRP